MNRRKGGARGLHRWLPTPFLKGSAALHLGAALLAALSPGRWRWALAAILANQAAMGVASLLPKSSLLGPNLTRLPEGSRSEVALTFDDGPDAEITPRVLDLLDGAAARASFFVVGHRAEALPALARDIARRGHKLENHTWSHSPLFAFGGPSRLRREVGRAQSLIEALTGRAPRWFRPPAGMRTPLLPGVLAEAGLGSASWTRRGYDSVSRRPDRVIGRLERGLAAGDILLLHDGRWDRRARRPPVLDVLPDLLRTLAERGLKGVALPDHPLPKGLS